tara:strand:+ start:382 stop:1005 length:624 start_codon:yes stop_codon:yes gene_type:complete
MITVFLIILCYILGSISGSIVLGKLKGIDVRQSGSGNAGATNAFRTVGPFFAISVLIIDVLKSYVPLTLIPMFFNNISELSLILCGLAAVLGHVYPIFHNFKGGKGAGTLVGIIIALFPECFLYILLVWLTSLVLTGYVGLSTVLGGFSLIIFTYFKYPLGIFSAFGYFTLLVGLFLIFTHRSNFKRMINGNENRFEKIMIFKRLFR